MSQSILNIQRTTLVTMSDGWHLVRITNLISKQSEYRWYPPKTKS